MDGDFIDARDEDKDGDGVDNDEDAFPEDATETKMLTMTVLVITRIPT